jgi:hypothetical protein
MFMVIEVISGLPEMEALGYDLRSIVDIEDIERISKCLPSTLIALHLQFSWENVPLNDPEMEHLLDRLKEMDKLQFLHVHTMYRSKLNVAENLAFALTSVQVLGFGAEFWDVVRSGEHVRVLDWTYKQVIMRSAETVGEPGEW